MNSAVSTVVLFINRAEIRVQSRKIIEMMETQVPQQLLLLVFYNGESVMECVKCLTVEFRYKVGPQLFSAVSHDN